MEIRKIRERMGEIYQRLEEIEQAAESRNEPLTQEEHTESENLQTEYRSLEQTLELKLNRRAMEAAQSGQRLNGGEQKEKKNIRRSYNFGKVVASQLPNSSVRLDGIEAEMHEEAIRETRGFGEQITGVGVPSFLVCDVKDYRNDKLRDWMERKGLNPEFRDVIAGTDTAGGHTVMEEVGQIIDQFMPRLQVRRLGAQMMTGLTNDLKFPRQTARAVATFKTEQGALDESSPTWEGVQMTPHRCGTWVDHSKQVIIQSVQNPSITSWITQDIRRAMSIKLDQVLINGDDGSNEPQGILDYAGIGSVAIGTNGGAPTWDHIVELEEKIAEDNADFGMLAYLTTPGVRRVLKTTLKASGVAGYVWDTVPFGIDNSAPGDGSMNGYLAAVSTQVPSTLTKGTGTGLHAILYGNWSQLVVGQWGGMDVLVDPYSRGTEGTIRIVVETFWDSMLTHEESFAAIVDASVA